GNQVSRIGPDLPLGRIRNAVEEIRKRAEPVCGPICRVCKSSAEAKIAANVSNVALDVVGPKDINAKLKVVFSGEPVQRLADREVLVQIIERNIGAVAGVRKSVDPDRREPPNGWIARRWEARDTKHGNVILIIVFRHRLAVLPPKADSEIVD